MLHEISSIIANVIEATELDKIETEATTPEAIETNAAQEATTDANAEPIEEEAPEEIEEEDDDEIDDFDPANSERVKDAREKEDEETVKALEEIAAEIGASELDEMDDDDVIFLIAANFNGESVSDVKTTLKYHDYLLYDGCYTLEEVGERYVDEGGYNAELEKRHGDDFISRYYHFDAEQWARDFNIENSNQYVDYGDFHGFVSWL